MARSSKTRNTSEACKIYNQRTLLPRDSVNDERNAPIQPWISTVMSVVDSSLPYTTRDKDVAQPSTPPLTPQRCPEQNSSGLQVQAKTSTASTATRILPKNSGKQATIATTMSTMATRADDMSNVISTMPQQQEYSYPPLEDMGMQDPVQPYNLSEHRPFSHMVADDRSYEPDQQHQHQHHDSMPQAPPRYPSPPPNGDPYGAPGMHAHTAQLVTELQNAMGGIEDHEDHDDGTKDGTHEPESPGRSKPVPKPDRPITKDANGRFFCDWPHCNEPVKDFGRKCEWS